MLTTAAHSLFLSAGALLGMAIAEGQQHSVLWFCRPRLVRQHGALVPGLDIVKERPVRPIMIVAIPIRASTVYARKALG